MATIAAEKPRFRTEPSAYEALKEHFDQHPDQRMHHTHKWDVSRSDIYAEDRWQPTFREMREAGPLHYIPESPFGPYWAVVQHKAIQHIEALPDLFSSSWEHGGITILERADDIPRKSGSNCRCSSPWTGPSTPASAAPWPPPSRRAK
jgi:hypothetical protein